MVNLNKLFLTLIVGGFLIFVASLSFAQETSPAEETTGVGGGYSPITTAEETVNLDENIQPADLGIDEPRILPDSPFYFLKNLGRAIQSTFTFNSVAKAELKERFANEKLMELKKMVEENKNSEAIKKATNNYQDEVNKIKQAAEKIKEKAAENTRVDKFLDKFIQQQTLHQKLLQKLENQVPAEAFEKIKEAREEHLERFQDVMLKLEDREEKITEKLDKILEEQKGSEFKAFKNLEVLKNLEEKVPEEAKEAIQKAQEKVMERFQENLEKMTPEKQEQLKDYVEKISGEKEKQLEIMENLKAKIKEAPATPIRIELKERLEEGKIKVLEKIEEKLEKLECPSWIPLAPDFCKEGRMIIEKDNKGCPLAPQCIIPGEAETPKKQEGTGVCITLWNPVCGKNGKTYSNDCFAKAAGVEIDYKGMCEKERISLPKESPAPKESPTPRESPEPKQGRIEQIKGTLEQIKEIPGKILPKILPQKPEGGTKTESTPTPFMPKPFPESIKPITPIEKSVSPIVY